LNNLQEAKELNQQLDLLNTRTLQEKITRIFNETEEKKISGRTSRENERLSNTARGHDNKEDASGQKMSRRYNSVDWNK